MRREKRDPRSRHRRRRLIYWTEACCMAALLAVIYLNQTKIMGWLHSSSNAEITKEQSEQIEKEQSETGADEKDSMETAAVQKEEQQKNSVLERQETAPEQPEDEEVMQRRRTRQLDQIRDQEIHGAYYSSARVSNRDKVLTIIKRMKGTPMNAVVIDLKDDTGYLTFHSTNQLAESIQAVHPVIWDLQEMTELFHENGIYVIGRVVAFRDSLLAVREPSYSIVRKDGSVFRDRAKDTWLNPYNKECWKYLLDVSEEALAAGVDEIQFDYVRFSTEAKADKVKFGVDSEKYTKTQAITDFVTYASKRIHKQGGRISADVFGTIINSGVDAKIVGQDYVELSKHLDYICPMIYPSHYADGCYGLAVPDLQPYELILGALNDSVNRLLAIQDQQHCAKVRPWLQDFTASWKKKYQKYGDKEVKEQIQGVNDAGYSQWLLWNSSGRYSTLK